MPMKRKMDVRSRLLSCLLLPGEEEEEERVEEERRKRVEGRGKYHASMLVVFDI